MNPSKLPKYIQPIRLAERDETLSGDLPLSSFTRLSPLLLQQEGTVSIALRFGRDQERFFYIQGTISASLSLQCQRCLQAMDYPLQLTVSLSPMFDKASIKKLPSCYEPLQMQQDKVDLIELLEDELLLALPLVPKHETLDCGQGDKKIS